MLDNVVSIITDALRALCGFLCNMLYPGIASFYELFTEIGTVVYSGGLDVIYKKISLIIGIFMIFRVTFWLIESLINPDMISDKEKNPGKIIQKVIISVVLLAITPTIFEKAFELQSAIVSNQTIEKIISVNDVSDSTATGRFLAAELFIGFYTPAETNSGTVNSDCTDYTGRDGIHYSTLYNDGKLDINNSCLTKKINSEDDYSAYEINFNALFATAVGAIVFWMILMYCISLGARYAQLIYLQIIAPIPIMCYLTPNKDNMFSKWLKQCTTTYLDLFIRIAIINFVMILCNMLLHNDNNSLLSTDNPAVKIFLILGLLIFAKKAPDLIQELLPKSVTKASGDFGLSLKKRADSMLGGKFLYSSGKKAIGFAAALPGIGISTGVRAYNASKYNQRENAKLNKYRNNELNRLKAARDRVANNTTLDPTKRAEGLAKFDAKIKEMENKSNNALRKDLSRKNKGLIDAYNRVKDTDPEAAAKLMEKITENRNSGMGQRNQATTFATSILGGTARAADAAIHGKNIGEIVKKSNDSHVKQIMQEQGWYKEGGYSFGNVVQRTISEVQRKLGIETEGQAIQYIVDEMKGDIKAQEEVLNDAKDKEKGYSSSKASVKAVESEGSSDLNKNKAILSYDPTTGGVKEIKFSTRTGMMKSTLERAKEYYNGLSTAASMEPVAGNKESSSYQVLSNLIESIATNSSHNPSEQNAIKDKLTKVLDNSSNFETAFSSIITSSEQEIGRVEGDYGKNQAAAALLTHLFDKKGYEGDFMDKQYKNQTIVNEYESLMREINANPTRYSDEINALKEKIETFVDGKDLTYYTEDSMIDLRKNWSKLKDLFEIAQAEQKLVVDAETDKLQQLKHKESAFSGYTGTQDALNADKYGGKN